MFEILFAGLALLGVYLLFRRIWVAVEQRSELITALSNSGEDVQGTPPSDGAPETTASRTALSASVPARNLRRALQAPSGEL